MKKILFTLAITALISTQAFAEEDAYVEKAVDLEEFSSRLNRIPPEKYIEIKAPAEESAHRAAQKLTPQEVKMLISSQNRINKRIAEQNGEPEPESINIDINDKQAVEEILTPDIYTYDDM